MFDTIYAEPNLHPCQSEAMVTVICQRSATGETSVFAPQTLFCPVHSPLDGVALSLQIKYLSIYCERNII